MQNDHQRILEIACFSKNAADIAIRAGAHRIELCSDYKSGGITPDINTLKTVRKYTEFEIFVMIRPRSGGFLYNAEEFTEMKNSLYYMKNEGADGFVFGILNKNSCLDTEKCSILVEKASPLPCTLHRSYDLIGDFRLGIEEASSVGFRRILTAGGQGNCIENIQRLTEIVNYSGKRIEIIAGGGVRSYNLPELLKINGLSEFHSSAIKSGSSLPDSGEIKNMKSILLSFP